MSKGMDVYDFEHWHHRQSSGVVSKIHIPEPIIQDEENDDNEHDNDDDKDNEFFYTIDI